MTRGIAVGAYANHADPVAPDKDIVAVFSTRIAYIGYTLRSLIEKNEWSDFGEPSACASVSCLPPPLFA